jgi:putative membrane protein
MKSRFFSFLIAGAAISFAACQGTGDGTDTTSDSAAIEKAPDNTRVGDTDDTVSSSTALDNKTSDFTKEAANGGMMEVELGQLAQQKAVTQRVKDFGTMMVRDHSKANEDLKNAVSGKITLSTTMPDQYQKHVNHLRDESGIAFDKEYMKMMVDDHEKDIKKFEEIAKESKDPAVRDFAKNTLPTLYTHLDSAKAIRNDLSKMKK